MASFESQCQKMLFSQFLLLLILSWMFVFILVLKEKIHKPQYNFGILWTVCSTQTIINTIYFSGHFALSNFIRFDDIFFVWRINCKNVLMESDICFDLVISYVRVEFVVVGIYTISECYLHHVLSSSFMNSVTLVIWVEFFFSFFWFRHFCIHNKKKCKSQKQ